ncbi:hypothetical protein H9Y04_00195 [Streptomyces sp. TRM66268-LWL]|uniref:Uncharacterized protein n=1 Tax=Streptomyces polyasparticus TaxID=2767826 RepID=A0ABR7S7W7_9ACTN|nr:hypothetical protein [Streptomyces polyasparticus]MBC9710994.1 hypothetical protein [Streptomyces polyasparticus]
MAFGRSREWCRLRGGEARAGVIRAELTLCPAGEAFRRTPVPGAGVLRPMWDIGAGGARELDIARLWVEHAAELAPGATATVRLLPLTAARWRQLAPGDRITLYETAEAGGTGVVVEVRPPETIALPRRVRVVIE